MSDLNILEGSGPLTIKAEWINKNIYVIKTYTDDYGNLKSVKSNIIGPITNAPYIPPSIQGPLKISNTGTTKDSKCSADLSVFSDIGLLDSYTYQWLRNGVPIVGATSKDYTITNDDIKKTVSLQLNYILKSSGLTGSILSENSVVVTYVNNAPSGTFGAITVTGSPSYQVSLRSVITNTDGQSLSGDELSITAGLFGDADGIVGNINYYWLDDPTNKFSHPPTETPTFTRKIKATDVGKILEMYFAYTNNYGDVEIWRSATAFNIIKAL